MSTEALDVVEIVETPIHAIASGSRVIGGIGHLEEYLMLAERISRTAMVPPALRNRPDEILAVVLYGAELGIGPMQALQQINFVAGKPSAAAELLRALVMDAGHSFVLSGDALTATAQVKRKDWAEWRETTFTIEDAQRAALCQGDGWRKYPDQMLAARVTSKACRMYFPDVIAGMSYTPDEVESFSTPPMRQQPGPVTSRRDVQEIVTSVPATADQKYALDTSISLLDEFDQTRLRAMWRESGLPPKARLTESEAAIAIELVSAILNEVTIDEAERSDADVTVENETESGAAVTPNQLHAVAELGAAATPTQVRALHTLLAKCNIAGPAKHEKVGEIIGRPVESMNDLTKVEASVVIDKLKTEVDDGATV